MLSKDHFYWEMFRKYVIAFSHIIDDIHVIRSDENNNIIKDITVPITYTTKSKLFYYLQRDSEIKRKIRTMLPRISYIINAMEFDPTRKTNSLNEVSISTSGGTETFQYVGLPYNFTIELSIWSMYMNDLLQIIEQLATFFKPDFSVNVKEIESLNITKSIPIILNGITFDIENEFDIDDRIVRAEASFVLKGFLYPPVSQSSVIKHINIAMKDFDSRDVTHETVQIDWSEINERIETTIKTGSAFFEFNSQSDISATTISTGDKS